MTSDVILDGVKAEVGQEPASWLALADALDDDGREKQAEAVRDVCVPLAEAHASRPHLRPLTSPVLAWLAVDPIGRTDTVGHYLHLIGVRRDGEWVPARVRTAAGTEMDKFVRRNAGQIDRIMELVTAHARTPDIVAMTESGVRVCWTLCYIRQEGGR